jgi:fructosamine-3-kinase
MFESEMEGLLHLSEKTPFKVPKPLNVLRLGSASGLLMEWIEKSEPDELSWKKFWTQLGEMHSVTSKKFGLEKDNFIGTLQQQNDPEEIWIEFWIERRISPFLTLAIEKGQLKDKDIMPFLILFDKARHRLKDHRFKPSLMHGDLWHGNLIFDPAGDPVLVDPAIYYGWPEMELAFMRFFGGFSKSGMENYNPNCKSEFLGEDFDHLWQLYPLLVHTVLFGGMYPRRLMNTVSVCLETI